jgi:hypothetical protein
MTNHSESESQITTDRQTIESWATDANVVPVRRRGRRSEKDVELLEEDRIDESDETVSWDEFFSTMEDQDMVVIAHEGDQFEVLERDEAMGRATVESDELKTALMEGEVVTSTITETTVIERTVVEEAQIESRVADREQVESTIENAELLSRDVEGCDVMETDQNRAESLSHDQFEAGAEITDDFDVQVTVDETWSLTRDVLERLFIESQVVDTEATETDTVEADEIESTIDVEGVQQTILESDLIDTDASPSQVIESGSIHTEFGEGDVVQTELMERKSVEEELALRKVFTGTIEQGETETVETVSKETIQSEIVDEGAMGVDREGIERGATTAESEQMEGERGEHVEAGAEAGQVPTEDDEGKTVVDATGEEVGIVAEVESDTMYVEPHPSLTDKIKAALDWGGRNEDTYPVTASQISTITDDQVELTVDTE